ncbi:[FeFe] hydrogenase H-cluster radical SAM maturase HydE [Calditrichota bacterium LG25]
MLSKKEIIRWLKEKDAQRLETLWLQADRIREQYVGNAVYFRGIIEISNYCARYCTYCGINAGNKTLKRYRLSMDEILTVVQTIERLDYGTVVLQAGEDPALTGEWITELIKRIKNESNLAVTLSLGERTPEELEAWRLAGADRYLLKFETADLRLFNEIHPLRNNGPWKNRLEILHFLKQIGYETGSGIMIGLPGQTYDELAEAILLFQELDLDMIGNGPFIPHPDTPLGKEYERMKNSDQQAPNDALTTCKVNALTRMVCPTVNIPSTTALATIDRQQGRENGLLRGANVIMPDFTPLPYRQWYEIYPGRLQAYKPPEEQHALLLQMLHKIGRTMGRGKGASLNYLKRKDGTFDS